MYKIKLADGTELDNLVLNGNNFISESVISDEVFSSDNLSTVIITDENGSTEYRNMKLVQNKVHGSQSWFILAEKSKDEIEKEKLGQEISEREIQEIIQGKQISDLEIRLLMGGL